MFNYSRLKVNAARLCPGRAFADEYITVLKIEARICEDGRRVTMKSF